MEGHKKCGKCQEMLPFERFSPNRRMSLKLQTYCKKCARDWHRANPDYVREKNKKWRESNPDYTRNWLRLKKIGVTPEQVEALREAQNNKCCGCGVGFEAKKGKREHVDHCHKTGRVRGLLCNKCNMILGACQDSPQTLSNLADYLTKNGPQGDTP